MSEALKKAREAREKMKAEGIEPERLDPIEKAKRNPKSLRLAVNAKCFDCCCGIKAEVTHCGAKPCPLWNVRPYQGRE